VTAVVPSDLVDEASSPSGRRALGVARVVGRYAVAYAAALVIFGAIVMTKGANPVDAVVDMVRSTLNVRSSGDVLVRASPLILAALAVSVPARAGLVNVGGEGQIVMGSVGAAGVALWLGDGSPGWMVILAMAVAAAATGAMWAGLAGGLRVAMRIPEAITTLLLNYVAIDVMLYLVYDTWKDPAGTGQPTSRPLPGGSQLATFGASRVHVGIVIAVVAAAAVWLVLRFSAWGFTLKVVGGNGDAARRAGLPVGRLLLSAMIVGGALAGLAGMVHFAGTEFKLRQGMTAGFGYTAFLASWLGRHHPLKVTLGALLLAFLAIGGSSLQLDAKLPAATVNILMALVLLAVLATGASGRRTGRVGR
jgi:general nucleoside transport system permease protein